MSGFQVEIVAAGAMREADWNAWRAMLDANPELDSPYFRPQFAKVAAAVSPDAAVARFARDGRVVGFFPHQRRGGAVQPLGAPMNDYHGVIAAPGEGPGLEEVARLLGGSRLNVTAWVGETGLGDARRTVQVRLPHGEPGRRYDAWYAERRDSQGKFFKDKERARRSLERDLGMIRVERQITEPAMLDWLIGIKREQYRRTGRHDIFACGWTARLLHALMETRTENFGASMAAMWAGDSLVAVEYSLHSGDQCHFWFPGYDPALSRCSPGILLSMDTMRLADAQGYRVFDFGFEGEHYKKYFCNAERTVREAVVVRPGLGAAVSQAAVGALNLAGQARGERLRASVRRRWAAIEACEVTTGDRLKGAMQAAGAALAKARAHPPRSVSA